MTILDELKVVVLDENAKMVSLNELREGRAMVLDFWTTKCVKCPAALSKLNEEAEEDSSADLVFVSCALSQGEGNRELVADMLEDWESMTHVFMEPGAKEAAKNAFAFAQVPFLLVVSKSGAVLGMGDPKSTDYKALLAAAAEDEQKLAAAPEAEAAVPAPANVFTLDEDF